MRDLDDPQASAVQSLGAVQALQLEPRKARQLVFVEQLRRERAKVGMKAPRLRQEEAQFGRNGLLFTEDVTQDGGVGAGRVAFLANDGEHLVIGHDGGNLLPLDHRVDEPVITFVCHAQVIRTVPLNELVTDPAVLQKTASHGWWGDYVGFDKRGAFLVQTADKRRWSFDVATGRLIVQKEPPK